jgi:hypothetical protein
MARLSKVLFAILIGFSFVVGSATASPIRRRHRRHGRGYKHAGKRVAHGGKRFGKSVGRAGKGVGRGAGRAGKKTGRKMKHIVT